MLRIVRWRLDFLAVLFGWHGTMGLGHPGTIRTLVIHDGLALVGFGRMRGGRLLLIR